MFHFLSACVLVLTSFPSLPVFLQFLVLYASKRLEQLFVSVLYLWTASTNCLQKWNEMPPLASKEHENELFFHARTFMNIEISAQLAKKNVVNSLSRFWRQSCLHECTLFNSPKGIVETDYSAPRAVVIFIFLISSFYLTITPWK